MKLPTTVPVLLGLLVSAFPGSEASDAKLVAEFTPPPVFLNKNLVRIISLDKNYVKEKINVLVENIAGEPQAEYYLPMTADLMSRTGGFEVHDRKDASSGAFTVERVDLDESSPLQYYRIRFPTPLPAGGQHTLGISFYRLKAYEPLPVSIDQEDKQFLVYEFSVLAPSAYSTLMQKTEVKAPPSTVPSSVEVEGEGGGSRKPEKKDNKLVYGPYGEKAAFSLRNTQLWFEFTKSVTHVSNLDRDIEVSHWGGNVAFEESYTLHHRGANLSSHFDRARWMHSKYYNPTSLALHDLRFPLHASSRDVYYTDVIGNVSTSNFRSNKLEALLEIKTRYPLYGGWKYPFTIGWNLDAGHVVRRTASGGYVLMVPFMEGPKQGEGVEYGRINIRVLLPEGARNVRIHANVPEAALTELKVAVHKTYLDTLGRTTVIVRAHNLVDEFRDRSLLIAYETSFSDTLRKPLLVFASMVTVFVTAWALGNVEMGFSKP